MEMYGSQNLFVLGYIILHPNWRFSCSSSSHGDIWLGWLRRPRDLDFFLRCSKISCWLSCAGGCDLFLCRFWCLRCLRLWCNFVWWSYDLCDLWLVVQNVPLLWSFNNMGLFIGDHQIFPISSL